MPALKVNKPTQAQLAKFVATVAASPGGTLTTSPAMQANKPVADWLISKGEYLPPELAALGLTCERSGRGHRYTCQPMDHANSASLPGLKRAGKKALEAKDWEWFAKQVPTPQWNMLIHKIQTAGLVGIEELLTPYRGSDIFKAIIWHPNKLPPALAQVGVTYDPTRRELALI